MNRLHFGRDLWGHSHGMWRAVHPDGARMYMSTQAFFSSSRKPPRLRLWLLIPSGAFLALYSYPRKTSPLPQLLASPSIIPTRRNIPVALDQEAIASSAYEPPRSFSSRIVYLVKYYVVEPIFTGLRFVHLCVYFLPLMLTCPMLLVGKADSRLNGDRWGAVWWYDLLTTQMQRAGPTFIKMAQWAASRADLFPEQLCDKLGSLHSTTKPHPLRYTKKVIQNVFGRPFDEIFEDFDEEPLGSGAIAQVYRATLRKNLLPPSYLNPKRPRGFKPTIAADAVVPAAPPPITPTAEVAVKVLHPHVDKIINRDLKIMSFFANCIAALPGMEWVSLPEEVEVFGKMMREQLDLRHEAKNLEVFEHNFNGRRENAVNFPRPLKDYSSKDVLFEEYEDALPLSSFLKNGGGPFDAILATSGLDVFLNMLLLDNFVHSDLHPGNIMVKFYKPSTGYVLQNIWASLSGASRPEDPMLRQGAEAMSDNIVARLRPLKNSRKEWLEEMEKLARDGFQPELVMLDAGLVTQLGETDRRNFLELFRAIAEFDGYRAGKLMIERCRTPELAIDTEVFAYKIQHLALSVKAKTFSLGQIKISDVLTEVLKAVQAHHVKMEGDFVNTVVSIMLLEGIGRQLDPDMDLFKSALPILRKLGRQMSPKDVTSNVGDLGAMLKFWVWIEARELANSAFSDADDFIRYDWMTPNI